MTTTTTTPETRAASAPSAAEFAEQLFGAILGAQFVQAAYLGDRLGYYRAMAGGEALTSTELASRTGTAERYAREWLEHQAVCGVLAVDDVAADPAARRFTLPAGPAEVLTDVVSPAHVLPIARIVAGLGLHLDALAAAYRSGGGVGWGEFGADAREGQAAANRPLFVGAMPRQYLPSVPDVAAALRDGGRVADIGCGHGWSAIGIALAHPGVTVDGYDLDAPSVAAARANAVEAGVADRVRFHLADAATASGRYDLVAAFRVRPRHARPGVGARHDAPPRRARRCRAGDGRERLRVVHRARQRGRAGHVRLQHHVLPARRAVARTVGWHGDRDAPGDPAPVRRRGRVRRRRGAADRGRVLPVLPAPVSRILTYRHCRNPRTRADPSSEARSRGTT
jgi:SAM-dependent methyltransferase